jgi:hypothetical protein
MWPEKLLARFTHSRIRRRGMRGGLFFVDQRKLVAEQLRWRQQFGLAYEPIAPL